MTLFIRNSLSILFLHVPKCGGSSIVELLSASKFLPQLQLRGLPIQDCLYASPQHQTSSVLQNLINIKNLTDIFILVRNPYERLKSEYKWKFRDTPTNIQPDVNEWVLESLKLSSEDPLYNDNHFRPAIDFIEINMPCRIFRLEEGIEMIAEFYLHEDRLIHLANKIHEKDSSKFSNKPLELNFNNASLNAINHFYRDDFSAFGYEMINENNKHLGDKENKVLYNPEKVNAVSQWREETLVLLRKKLMEQLATLDLELKKKSSFINDKAKNDVKIIAFGDVAENLYDDVLLRLSSLKNVLNLTNTPLTSNNCAYQLQRLLLIINQYRARIQESTQ